MTHKARTGPDRLESVSAAASGTEPGKLSRDGLAGAAAWRIVYLTIQGGSSVVLFAALSHVLSERQFAAAAVAQGVIVIAQSIGDFGLSQAAVTVLPARIAERRGDPAELLSGAATAYLGATGLALVLTLAAVPVVPSVAAGPVAVSGIAAAAAVIVSGADGILRAQGEFRRPVLLMACSELAGFIGVPVAVLTDSALWTSAAVAAGMAIGAAACAVVLLRLRRAAPDAAVRPFARASLPLGISQVFIALATRADTLIAGVVSGLLAAGTFEGCWRIYQLSLYVVGGMASAAAPFIADALGATRTRDAGAVIRRLSFRLLGLGLLGGALLYLLRVPLADLLAGSLGHGVARALPVFAVVSPLQAVSLVGYYTLIGQDGQRRYVLLTNVAGAIVNVALAAPLGHELGARGIVIGCAAGQAVAALLLLARFIPAARLLNRTEPQVADQPAEHSEPLR